MTEEHKERQVPKDTYVTQNLDWNRLLNDFDQWTMEKIDAEETRGKRYLKNMVHMFGTLVTAGAYPLAYIGYFVYKFIQTVDMDDYKVEVEHKVYEDGSNEERSK